MRAECDGFDELSVLGVLLDRFSRVRHSAVGGLEHSRLHEIPRVRIKSILYSE